MLFVQQLTAHCLYGRLDRQCKSRVGAEDGTISFKTSLRTAESKCTSSPICLNRHYSCSCITTINYCYAHNSASLDIDLCISVLDIAENIFHVHLIISVLVRTTSPTACRNALEAPTSRSINCPCTVLNSACYLVK